MELEEQKKKLDELIPKLVSYGENEAELLFWKEIFDTMGTPEREALLGNLTSECQKLEKLLDKEK